MLSGFTAWVDESGSNPRTDPGTYILSAVICEGAQVEAARATMRGLLLAKGGKLHWRDEDRARQEHIVKSIADLSVEHLIVVRSNASPTDRLERQRRLCMERMLPELAAFGIDTAVFESRGPKDDQRDLQTLDYLRRKQMLAGHLRIDHVGGPVEPLLWIADACCGATVQMRSGDTHHYRLIESKITLIDIKA